MTDPQKDFVLKTIESRDVHFVRFWFTDVLGNMKSFAVIESELENAFAEGMGFDGRCVEGFSNGEESDMLAFPCPDTFQVLPWRPDSNAVARMFCDIRKPDGTSFEGSPRHILNKLVCKAQDKGYVFNVGPELEFFYFKDQNSPELLDRGGLFDLTSLDSATELRRDTVLTLEKMGIPVEYSHHESGASQHEIDLRFTDALSMADAVMTYKLVVKEIALKNGVHASFMPKPLANQPGNSMHIHMSLWDFDEKNLFFDKSDPTGMNLSALAKSYIAGILKYAPEFCLITNQYVNSYKRLTETLDSPINLTWSRTDKRSIVRIPGTRPDSEAACRIELRNADPAANPYLVFAATLAAGMAGIEEGLKLADPVCGSDNLPLDRKSLEKMGIGTLPADLGEAIDLFENSKLMKDTLGEHVHSYLVAAKRAEWREYQELVSQWELDKYLAVL